MVFTGMIYQYNNTEGTGLIMLSDGKTKEFRTNDWIDAVNLPAIGQKVSYKSDSNGIEIKVAVEENISIDAIEECTSVEDYLKYFTDLGYKLAKDKEEDATRTILLRLYTPTDYGEAIITKKDSKITLEHTLNGKVALVK